MTRDVVIIGAGPAGLRLAYKLARGGFDVVVFDDRAEIGKHKICTGIVSPEAFDRFQLPKGSILSAIQRLRFFSPQDAQLEYVHSTVLAYAVDRTAFDQSLGDMARAEGAELRIGTRVERVNVDLDGVRVDAAAVGLPESRQRLNARLVAITTGVNSKLNRSLGLGVPVDFLNAAQAHIKVRNLDGTTCYVGRNVAPGAFAWVVPLDGDRARVGLMAEKKASDYFEGLLRRIADYRNSPAETVEIDFKPIAQRFVGKTYGCRVVAAGEAAGQVKTTTGGGIYYGMLCAEVAAEVLAEALQQGRYDESFMAQYEEKWKAEIQRELELGYAFRKAFSKLSDRQIEKLFALASFDGILPLIKMTAKFDWHAEILNALARYGLIRRMLGIDLRSLG